MDEGGGRGQGQVLGSQGPPAQKLTPGGGAPGGPGGGCDAPRGSDASGVILGLDSRWMGVLRGPGGW